MEDFKEATAIILLFMLIKRTKPLSKLSSFLPIVLRNNLQKAKFN